jgi:hypothetical protein
MAKTSSDAVQSSKRLLIFRKKAISRSTMNSKELEQPSRSNKHADPLHFSASLTYPEDRGRKFLRNVELQANRVPYSLRQYS